MSLDDYSTTKLEDVLGRKVGKAIGKFNLIEKGDRIVLGLSGGQDSRVLLHLLRKKERQKITDFKVLPVHVDLGFEDNNKIVESLRKFCSNYGYELQVIKTDIVEKAFSDDAPFNPCFICSRMRRKNLIEFADEHGCNKLGLGHHRDDIIETFFINVFYGREISTMDPNQELFDGKYRIIRPLALCDEKFIKEFAQRRNIEEAESLCPQDGNSKRDRIKEWLSRIYEEDKITRQNVFQSLFNPKVDYLLEQYKSKST